MTINFALKMPYEKIAPTCLFDVPTPLYTVCMHYKFETTHYHNFNLLSIKPQGPLVSFYWGLGPNPNPES